MRTLDLSELTVANESVKMDDSMLVRLSNQLYCDTKEKKEKFDDKVLHFNQDDYLSVAIARLAYFFSKEKYESMCE